MFWGGCRCFLKVQQLKVMEDAKQARRTAYACTLCSMYSTEDSRVLVHTAGTNDIFTLHSLGACPIKNLLQYHFTSSYNSYKSILILIITALHVRVSLMAKLL